MSATENAASVAEQTKEPRCLVPPTVKWYRPGQGFTCRQIMLPLIGLMVILVALGVVGSMIAGNPEHAQTWWAAQLVLLGIAAVLIFRVLHFIRSSLLNPLTLVQHWVSQVRCGEFSARIGELPDGEFAELGRDINGLAEVFQTLSLDLESEVQAQTERLTHKSRSLEFLYEVAASINESSDVDELLTRFMRAVQQMVEAPAAIVRTLTADQQLRQVASTGIGRDFVESRDVLPMSYCLRGRVIAEEEVSVSEVGMTELKGRSFTEGTGLQMVAVPLQYRGRVLGVCNLFVTPGGPTTRDDIQELLTSTGRHLGMAIEQARLGLDAHRLALMEERTRLAYELHDSLAQTFASLRFQVRVLDDMLHQGDESLIWQELEKIENSVDEANTELRELIARFRAPMEQGGLVAGIEQLVARFREKEDIAIFLQNEWGDAGLPSDLEIEVVGIVQEALANIRKHSHATTVRIMLRHDRGHYRVLVEDDGGGFDDPDVSGELGEHIGLTIMQERAQCLGGVLRVESEPGEGTRVVLTFKYSNESGAKLALRQHAIG